MFVSDEKYAEPLCTALYSLLWNRDKTRLYDILILQDDISEKATEEIRSLADGEAGVSIRLVDMADVRQFFRKQQMHIIQRRSIIDCICLTKCFQIMTKCYISTVI